MEKRTRRIGIVDSAGRVIIPKKFRDEFGIDDGTKVDFSSIDGYITIRKATINCAICGSTENLTEFEEKAVCECCIKKIKKL